MGSGYLNAGAPPVPTKLLKEPPSILPPAFREAVKMAGVTPEAMAREPVSAAGNWVSTDAGTVNVCCPRWSGR